MNKAHVILNQLAHTLNDHSSTLLIIISKKVIQREIKILECPCLLKSKEDVLHVLSFEAVPAYVKVN